MADSRTDISIKQNTENTTTTISLMDSCVCRSLTFREIVNSVSIIRSIRESEALTEVSSMITINGMDAASDMVSNMRKDYLKKMGV